MVLCLVAGIVAVSTYISMSAARQMPCFSLPRYAIAMSLRDTQRVIYTTPIKVCNIAMHSPDSRPLPLTFLVPLLYCVADCGSCRHWAIKSTVNCTRSSKMLGWWQAMSPLTLVRRVSSWPLRCVHASMLHSPPLCTTPSLHMYKCHTQHYALSMYVCMYYVYVCAHTVLTSCSSHLLYGAKQ